MNVTDGRAGTAALLRAVPNFASLDDVDLARIAAHLHERSISAGEILMEEGAEGDESFLVIDGDASVITNGVPVARVGPGEFVGEVAVLTHARRGATVQALTPMRLLVLDSGALASLLDPITEALLGTLARRLRRSDDETSRLRPGATVAVRSRYTGAWVEGFEIAEFDLSGAATRILVRRLLDGATLPVWFPADEVRVL